MSLKFTFGGAGVSGVTQEGHDDTTPGIPLPFAGASHRAAATSSTLDMCVKLDGDEAVCEVLSGDGVSYARASLELTNHTIQSLAAAVRSVLARGGAELPEPLIESVTGITLSLGGDGHAVLSELGLGDGHGSPELTTVNEALQARTGVAAGTPIRLAD